LDNLLTYLIALAIAGGGDAPGAPEMRMEALGSDTTEFVEVPYDVVYAYYARARKASQNIPAAQRLEWLEAQDVEERSEWVAYFRDSDKTLGRVIKEVMVRRDAHWDRQGAGSSQGYAGNPQTPQRRGWGFTDTSSFMLGSPRKQSRTNGERGKSTGKGGGKGKGKGRDRKILQNLRNGNALCQAFQKNQCQTKGQSCPKGYHMCGVATGANQDRACGGKYHGACDHEE
jgi:hypothetical protein